DRLRGLAGQDVDRRQRRDQTTGIENAVDDGQHVRMYRNTLPDVVVREQVVDAERVVAFERVGRGLHVEKSNEAVGRVVQFGDQTGIDRVFDDGVALLGDLLYVQLDVHTRQTTAHGALRTR